jgi:RNA polymerase sigma-70 factor, ECF subfamily
MSTNATDSAETLRLLEQLEQGDRNAFEYLFARHRGSIREFAQRRISPRIQARLDSSDIVQETYLEASRMLDDFLARRPMPFSLWLTKTAYQRVAKAQRRHMGAAMRSVNREIPMPDGSSLLLAQRIVGSGSSPTDAVQRKECAQRVRQALCQLSDGEREVILMRVFERLTCREVACVLDITPEATQKRYARGLLKLRVLLQQSHDQES